VALPSTDRLATAVDKRATMELAIERSSASTARPSPSLVGSAGTL